MARIGKWIASSIVSLLAVLLILAWVGGAINWDRQPPYELVQSWGGKGSGPGQFSDPTGIAVTGGEIFVADARNSRIQVFDKRGQFLRLFGSEVLGRPMNLTIADGRLYAPDFFKDVIHVFTLQGSYQGAVKVDDGFNSPGGVAVRDDGTLLVADTYGQRVVHLTASGKVLREWSGSGISAGAFNYPTDVVATSGGGFYVADGYHDRIQQFDANGDFVRKWGGPFGMNIFGPFKGWFATVTSVAVGESGAVYAADFYNDRIQKFTDKGVFLTSFGVPAKGPGQSEIAVAVDDDGIVWTVNFAGNRVEKWRPPESN